MKRSLRTLKTGVGRVHWEIERKIAQGPEDDRPQVDAEFQQVQGIFLKKPKSKKKLYALHVPEVKCVS